MKLEYHGGHSEEAGVAAGASKHSATTFHVSSTPLRPTAILRGGLAGRQATLNPTPLHDRKRTASDTGLASLLSNSQASGMVSPHRER